MPEPCAAAKVQESTLQWRWKEWRKGGWTTMEEGKRFVRCLTNKQGKRVVLATQLQNNMNSSDSGGNQGVQGDFGTTAPSSLVLALGVIAAQQRGFSMKKVSVLPQSLTVLLPISLTVHHPKGWSHSHQSASAMCPLRFLGEQNSSGAHIYWWRFRTAFSKLPSLLYPP